MTPLTLAGDRACYLRATPDRTGAVPYNKQEWPMVALMIENSKLIAIFLLMAAIIVLSHVGNASGQRETRE